MLYLNKSIQILDIVCNSFPIKKWLQELYQALKWREERIRTFYLEASKVCQALICTFSFLYIIVIKIKLMIKMVTLLPASWSFQDVQSKMMNTCDPLFSVQNVLLLHFHIASSFSSFSWELECHLRKIFCDCRFHSRSLPHPNYNLPWYSLT